MKVEVLKNSKGYYVQFTIGVRTFKTITFSKESLAMEYRLELIEALTELPQHPTPTLTDKVIEDIVENSVTKNYVDGKFYAMRVARVALKKARDFMQSGEVDSVFEVQRLYDWLMDEKRKPANTAFTSGMTRNVAREIEFRLSQSGESPQESNGDGIDLVKTLEDVLSQIKSLGTYSRKQTDGSGRKYFYDASQVDKIIYNYLSTRQGEGGGKQPLSN